MRARWQLRRGRELDGGYDADASLTMAVVWEQEAKAIDGGRFRSEGEEAEYGTLGANPVVL